MLTTLAILLLIAFTRSHAVGQPSEPPFTLHSETRLVVVTVGVRDPHGKNVLGLQADDFRLFENRREQTIKQFAGEDRPVTVGLVVDASGSMRTKQAEVTAAALTFIRASNPEDEIFVVTFNDRASLGLPVNMPFASNARQLEAALSSRIPEGRTALYDALTLGAEHLAQGKWESKTLVVISDGGDNGSTHTLPDALESVRRSGAVVYTIGIFDPDEPEHDLNILRRLSHTSGGESFAPQTLTEIDPLCRRIAADIRASYTLAYTPPNPDRKNISRKLKIALAKPHPGITIRSRTTYSLDE
jgi:Ca-activated chloride channel family protein